MSSGILSPADAALDVFKDALHHLAEPLHLTFVKGIYGGLLLSSGGVLSNIVSHGVNGISEADPAVPSLLSGLTFPIGLILVYLVGAELYTGYPMWYTVTLLERRGSWIQYLRGPAVCWVGDLLGALIVAGVFSVVTGTLTEEPYRSGILSSVQNELVEPAWGIILLKAVACGWLVTMAMYLGTQQRDGVSRALGLYLPFFISSTAKFPHTVEYMYVGLLGLFLQDAGAESVGETGFTVGMYVWKCLGVITLGNTIGGSLGTGAYIWWVHLRDMDPKDKAQLDDTGLGIGDTMGAYSDEP